MKKTWKEHLYDVSCSRITEKCIPILLIDLGLLSFVCMIAFLFLVECQLLSTFLYGMLFFLPIIGMELRTFFDAVKSYKKEMFLCNKIRNSLLANEAFLSSLLYWSLMTVFSLIVGIIFNPDTYSFRVTVVIGFFLILFLILVICKPISKYFKKKLVYVETENTNVKDN